MISHEKREKENTHVQIFVFVAESLFLFIVYMILHVISTYPPTIGQTNLTTVTTTVNSSGASTCGLRPQSTTMPFSSAARRTATSFWKDSRCSADWNGVCFHQLDRFRKFLCIKFRFIKFWFVDSGEFPLANLRWRVWEGKMAGWNDLANFCLVSKIFIKEKWKLKVDG